MLIKKPADIPSSEITDEKTYLNRREFLREAGIIGAAAAGIGALPSIAGAGAQEDTPNTFEQISTYNNYYEFGTDKEDPSQNAHTLKTKPWSVAIEGHVAKPAVYDLEDFVKPNKLEDRIYRHRCVERWSMVIPWLGFPFKNIIDRVQPTSRAKFVEFITLYDPNQMPIARGSMGGYNWPYKEGLRIDEAMHPLAILAVGLYGKPLPNQNGAPLRLHVPWKYGFKSGKSIVKIRFVEEQPRTTWADEVGGNEYGFYANVNPDVPHPRWSQALEKRLPGLFTNRPTKLFNGYNEVASLYSGMDLRKYY